MKKRIHRQTDASGAVRSIRVPGTVSVYWEAKPQMRFRRLRNINDRSLIIIYGYCAFPPITGPWYGWPKDVLVNVACTHCGGINIFNREDWKHECPGNYEGTILPCCKPHPCEGKPSMSQDGIVRYLFTEWSEIRLEDDD